MTSVTDLQPIHGSSAKVLVLGAGACGLTAAWYLAKNGVEVDVIEVGPQVGGHASTIKIGDNIFADLAPHAFHIKDTEVTAFVEELMGSSLRKIRSDTSMRINGKNFNFPLNIPNLLRGLNPFLSMRIVFDYMSANLKSKMFNVPERSFADWCTKRFGRTLADLCFLNYTRKVWGRNPSELSATLAKQKLVKLNLKDLIVKLIGFQGQEQPVYFREFYYPEEGIGQLWKTLASHVQKHGGRIQLELGVQQIEPNDGKITALHVRENVVKEFPDRDWIISTIPITTLIGGLGTLVPHEVQAAAGRLKFRSLILLFLVVARERVLQPQWIYFLDDEFTFNRLSDQKAMSEKMLVPDKTVLCFEKNCEHNDNIWNATPEEHLNKAIEELEQAKLLSRNEIESYDIFKIRYAYPQFDLEFQNNLNTIMQHLTGIERLLTVGRPGLFLNNDMHDSMEMGIMAAKYVMDHLGSDRTSQNWYSQISDYKRAKGW